MVNTSRFTVASRLVTALKVVRVLVGLTLAGAVCLFAASLFERPSGLQLSLPVSFHAETASAGVSVRDAGNGPARVEAIQGHANLVFVPPNRLFLAATGLTLIALLGLGLWLLQQLIAVFDSARCGHPFVMANAVRIRHMAYVIIAAEGVRLLGAIVWNGFAAAHFAVSGWRFDAIPEVHVTTVAAGLVVLALSEVFRAGTQLDEDQSLTV